MPKDVFQAPDVMVKIDLGGTMKFEGNITEMCRINPELLNEEVNQQPGTHGWLVALSAACTKAAAEAEDNLKVVISDVSLALREEAELSKMKTTEERLKLAVNADSRVISARDKVNAANYDADISKGLLDVYKKRADLIISLSNDRRSELKTIG